MGNGGTVLKQDSWGPRGVLGEGAVGQGTVSEGLMNQLLCLSQLARAFAKTAEGVAEGCWVCKVSEDFEHPLLCRSQLAGA